MSRATVDLQAVRFFLGYGLIFLLQSFLTLSLGAIAMFVLNPPLAAIALAPVPLVVLVGLALRPAQPAGAAGGSAADRRAHRQRRGERVGRAHRQGVRPRGVPGPALPPQRHARVRPVDALDPDPRLLHAAHRVPSQPRARGHPLLRRPPGDPRDPEPRRLRRVLRLPPDAHLPHALAGHLPRHGAAGRRVRRAGVPDPRPRAGDEGPGGRTGTAPGRRADRAAPRHDDLSGSLDARAARRLAGGRGGNHNRARGRHGIRQDDARLAHPPPLRRGRGGRAGGRRRRVEGRAHLTARRRSRWSRTTRSCSRPASPRTSPTPGPRPRARTSRRRPAAPRRTSSSPSCRTATTR